MRGGRALAEEWGVDGLDGDDLRFWLALAQYLADTGDGAARADAGDEDVDGAVGVGEDLLGGGLAVDRDVRLVLELAREHGAGGLRDDASGLFDGAVHSLRGVGLHELGAEGAQQHLALVRHRRGHREDHLVAAGGTDERERDARVARRSLDDRSAGGQIAGLLGGVDDRDAETVLDARTGVEELELGVDVGTGAVRHTVELDERSLSERTRDVVVDRSHGYAFRV